MQKLHELKGNLLKELREYGDRKSFSYDDIATIKNLASSINKICDIMDAEEGEEYSGRMSHRMSHRSYADGEHDSAYRGRDAMGRYTSGYSRHDIIDKLYEVMEEAPEHQKGDIMRLISKMEK